MENRKVVTIQVQNVSADHTPLNPDTYEIAKHLEGGGTVPPIHVQARGGTYKLLAGRHRLAAHRLLGRADINAIVGEAPRYPKGMALHE